MSSFRISWPRETSAEQLTAGLRALAATAGTPVTLDALGASGHVEHRIRVPEGRAHAVVTELRAAIPGLDLERLESADLPQFGLAIDLRVSTRRRPLRTDNQDDTARSLVHALAGVGRDEAVLLRWQLTDRLYPAVVPSRMTTLPAESFGRALLSAPFGAPAPADADVRSAMRDKQREPGWRIVGRLAVSAASPARRQQLANAVLGALRISEAPGVRLRGRSVRVRTVGRPPRHGRLRLNAVELTAVSGWPIGDTSTAPVDTIGSRRLPAVAAIPSESSVIGESTWPGKKRKLAMATDDRLRGTHILGPVGTGKSTLMLHLIEQDMTAGRGVIVVDPKGDLITDVLARVPDKRRGDVVVIDAGSAGGPVVGVNPLAASDGRAPEVAADGLLQVLRELYAASFGPRTNDVLSAALLTLARVGGHSLVSVPLLLSDAPFRRRVVGQLDDPFGLAPFWAQFEALSEPERAVAVAPVMRRLRPFLMRPNLRRIVGQPTPSFDFRDVFTRRRIVLVDLAKGRIGDESSQLLGAFVMTIIWQAAQAQAAVPADKRTPVVAYLDEFQDYLVLPISLEDALAQSRGLGLGFVLAHQFLRQLSPSVKAAVLANARSRICFQLSADDARELARNEARLSHEDFRSLDAFHFYAQLVAGNQVRPWCSGRSLPASKPVREADAMRRHAAEAFGTTEADIDAALERLRGPASKVTDGDDGDDFAPRRRGDAA